MRAVTFCGAIALATGLSACGPTSPEEARAAMISKCERQFGRMASDTSKGYALCSCFTDKLSDQGLEITDMLGPDRSSVEGALRSCAAQAGVQVPS